jgi:hypothetical protein
VSKPHIPTHSRLGAAGIGAAAVVGLAVLGGCSSALGSMAPGADMLAPRSVMLQPPSFDGGSFNISVYRRASPRDTAESPVTRVAMSEHDLATDSADAVIASEWGPPAGTMDSLVVDGRSLAPVSENFVDHGVRYEYRFHGTRVSGTIRRPGAAPQPFSRTFGEAVFARNEVGPLVRSLAYRNGLTEVVPLFSEVNGTLEHDTLTVLRERTPASGAPQWVVRFADPASTTAYVVDAGSRRIVSAVTTRRHSGAETVFRYGGGAIGS